MSEEYYDIMYEKNGEFVIENPTNVFVYHTSVFVRYKNYFSLIKNTFYSSPKEIKNIVWVTNKTPNIQIVTERYSAPKWWLLNNGYELYMSKKLLKKNELLNI